MPLCRLSVVVILLALAVPASAEPSLSVRVLNLANLEVEDVDRSLQVAAAIYRRVGIAVSWTVCGVCTEPTAAGDLWLRIASEPAGRSRVLGTSALDPTTGSGVMATVYSQAIAQRAREAGGPVVRLLGTVMAHELGHLVLGSTTHTTTGVMRHGWFGGDLHAPDPPAFSLEEGFALRARLAERVAAN